MVSQNLRDHVTGCAAIHLKLGQHSPPCCSPALHKQLRLRKQIRWWTYVREQEVLGQRLHRAIANQTDLKIGVCLTDKYPNIAAFLKKAQVVKSGGATTYSAEPVDAGRIPAEIAGFRTIFSSFHHFPPKDSGWPFFKKCSK